MLIGIRQTGLMRDFLCFSKKGDAACSFGGSVSGMTVLMMINFIEHSF